LRLLHLDKPHVLPVQIFCWTPTCYCDMLCDCSLRYVNPSLLFLFTWKEVSERHMRKVVQLTQRLFYFSSPKTHHDFFFSFLLFFLFSRVHP
jgi:hypothetical protein